MSRHLLCFLALSFFLVSCTGGTPHGAPSPTDDALLVYPTTCTAGPEILTGGPAAAAIDGANYTTIQDAIDAAVDGDTVHVCPGVHTEQLVVPTGLTLTLASWSGEAYDTVLDGASAHTPLRLDFNSIVTLEDLTFSNSVATYEICDVMTEFADGGAVHSSAESLVVRRCRFTHNTAEGSGGAIYHSNPEVGFVPPPPSTSVRIEDSAFHLNTARYAGGALSWVTLVPATFEVEGSLFVHNAAAYEGGGISVGGYEDYDLSISDSRFRDNQAVYCGGGIATGGWEEYELSVTDTDFHDNVALYSGGGIDAGGYGANEVVLDGVHFERNYSGSEGGALMAGGWLALDLQVACCTFAHNVASSNGGAVSLGAWDIQDITITDSGFTDNASGQGGALSMGTWGAQTLTMSDCQIEGNTAIEYGGAISLGGWADYQILDLTQVVLDGNDGGKDGAIHINGVAGDHPGTVEITLDTCTVTGNVGRGGVSMEHDYATVHSLDSDWGAGATDNTPSDVDTGGVTYSQYGSGATFTCEGWGVCS